MASGSLSSPRRADTVRRKSPLKLLSFYSHRYSLAGQLAGKGLRNLGPQILKTLSQYSRRPEDFALNRMLLQNRLLDRSHIQQRAVPAQRSLIERVQEKKTVRPFTRVTQNTWKWSHGPKYDYFKHVEIKFCKSKKQDVRTTTKGTAAGADYVKFPKSTAGALSRGAHWRRWLERDSGTGKYWPAWGQY